MQPIIDWTDRDVYQYLKKHDLPYHPLWEKGYVSIGDTHTTRPLTGDMTEEETPLLRPQARVRPPRIRRRHLIRPVRTVFRPLRCPARARPSAVLITGATVPIVLKTKEAMIAPMMGATMKSQSWSIAQPPTKIAWLMLRAGFTEVFVTGNADEMNQHQHEADGQAGEADRGFHVGRAENGEDEEEGQHDFRHESGAHRRNVPGE